MKRKHLEPDQKKHERKPHLEQQKRLKFIDRKTFVKICSDAIHECREKVTPINQKHGYIKFHKEEKFNNYTNELRVIKGLAIQEYGESLENMAFIVELAGLGRCFELAQFVCNKIRKDLKDLNVYATLNIVGSADPEIDHRYLRVKIKLKNEIVSEWEIEAWNPRLTDISPRPDGIRKNRDTLIYGRRPKTIKKYCTAEVDENACPNKIRFQKTLERFDFKKPEEGLADYDVYGNITPVHEMTNDTHPWLYCDYPLVEAYKAGWLDRKGNITKCQQVSDWQKRDDSNAHRLFKSNDRRENREPREHNREPREHNREHNREPREPREHREPRTITRRHTSR